MNSRISNIMKICSQRLYLLNQLIGTKASPVSILTLYFDQLYKNAYSIYALSSWCSFANKEQQGRIDAFLKRSYRFGFTQRLALLHKLLKELTTLSLLVLTIQAIVYISSYHPPGQSISEVEAIPTHCRPAHLICVRIVLSTDAYLVLFSF